MATHSQTGPHFRIIEAFTGIEVIKLEYSLRLKIKSNVWLLADTCPQAANHCALYSRSYSLAFWSNVNNKDTELDATNKMYHIKSATQTVIIITVEINPEKIVSISGNNGKLVIETK